MNQITHELSTEAFVPANRKTGPAVSAVHALVAAPCARGDLPPTRRDSPAALSPSTAPTQPQRRVPQVLACGAILDKYRIETLLGVGGAAAVYRAMHLLLRVQVALKVAGSSDGSVIRQLLEEARVTARINHPSVVRVHDVGYGGNATYIAMEYVDGPSLAKTIEESGPLPPTTVTAIATDVAEGLRAALREGIIHRDIKPANILLPSSGPARIVDFGLACLTSHRAPQRAPEHDERLVGTPGYMAPEQVRDPRCVDFRADIYSLGVTLSHALLGIAPSRPWGDASASRRLPPALVRLIGDMIAAPVERRPPSYDVLLSRLRGVQRVCAGVRAAV